MKIEDIAFQVIQGVACMHPGPDAICYVIQIGRYTDEDYKVFKRLKTLLGEEVIKHMVIIFTHGDILKMSLEEYIKVKQENFKKVLSDCQSRCIVFDNTVNSPAQVEQLLQIVRIMNRNNCNLPYKCPIYAIIGVKLDEEVFRTMVNERLQQQTQRDKNSQKDIDEYRRILEVYNDVYKRMEKVIEKLLNSGRDTSIATVPKDFNSRLQESIQRSGLKEKLSPGEVEELYAIKLLQMKDKIATISTSESLNKKKEDVCLIL